MNVYDEKSNFKYEQHDTESIKLLNSIEFDTIRKYGFEEDGANCDVSDHYYSSNNYYFQSGYFRIVINMHTRCIEVMCLPNELSLQQLSDLKPLYDLIKDGLVEVCED